MKLKNQTIVLILVAFLVVNLFSIVSATSSFEVGSVLIKVSVHQGDVVDKKITISANEAGQFSLSSGIQGVVLGEQDFALSSGESKTVNVKFDSSDLSEGVYVGEIKVKSAKDSYSIPVIFEVESVDVFVDGNLDISPEYSDIAPGDKLVAQLKVFDLSGSSDSGAVGSKKVNVEYKVYSIDGRVISSDAESIVVDRSIQATKTVAFDKSTKPGIYVFTVTMKYSTSVGTATYLFNVKSRTAGSYLEALSGGDMTLIVIMIVVLLFFAGLVFLFIYILRDRDKLILELRQYHNTELSRQKKILVGQARIAKSKGIVNFAQARRDVGEKLKHIRKTHEGRIDELRKLKKSGDTKTMKQKIAQWKKERHHLSPLKYSKGR